MARFSFDPSAVLVLVALSFLAATVSSDAATARPNAGLHASTDARRLHTRSRACSSAANAALHAFVFRPGLVG
ncbi:uncharacterized protein A4U43_C10F15750 [Asparagus officinalis]|uniref:Secreted protein n=1 Tax=Asparagus officinalis TaxID=4686 RepID=A0A5P1E303_ASPOF|nr:uncharacterized protein A4U43_C10F15750 [Asparagus officinalis]